MERLMDLGVNTTFLDTQRRMHQDIAEFSNKTFYNNKIKTEYNFNFDIAPIDIINVDGKENMEGTSFSNKIEAEKVNDIYNKLKETFDDVIVISPYTAQCNLFNKFVFSSLSKKYPTFLPICFLGFILLTLYRYDNNSINILTMKQAVKEAQEIVMQYNKDHISLTSSLEQSKLEETKNE